MCMRVAEIHMSDDVECFSQIVEICISMQRFSSNVALCMQSTAMFRWQTYAAVLVISSSLDW